MGEMKFVWAIVKGGVTHHRPQGVVWPLVDRLSSHRRLAVLPSAPPPPGPKGTPSFSGDNRIVCSCALSSAYMQLPQCVFITLTASPEPGPSPAWNQLRRWPGGYQEQPCSQTEQTFFVGRNDPRKITVTTGGDISSTEGKKLSKSQQLKKIFQEYGAVGVSLHIGLSLISLGMFYMVVSSGVDMSAILLKLGFKESLVQSKMAAGTSTFLVAYAIHKLFAPVRISITLVSVPLIVRYFRKVGFFKPPAAKP
ncbi:transmembrane domain containing protein [Camelus ferus]|nr:transmembrane domain containing protein [Camelus ferus]